MGSGIVPLDAATEVALIAQVQAGQHEPAFARLVAAQRGLAKLLLLAHSKRLSRQEVQELLDDIPLIIFHSVQRFDAAQGCRLATVLKYGVKAAVQGRFRGGAIHITRQKLATQPDAVKAASRCLSLHATDQVEGFDEPEARDFMGELVDRDLLGYTLRAVDQLGEPTADIIRRRTLGEESRESVGARYGTSREWVRRREAAGLERLQALAAG